MTKISDLKQFYKNKRVFITGHSGFKGSWLVLWLKEMGANVGSYSLVPEEESLFNLAQIDEGIISVFGDIRNYESLYNAIEKFQPDIIIHMAAQAFVLESYHNPISTYETNVIGTVNLFEAARKVSSIKSIVNVTTDKCYENKELNIAFKEEDRLGGHDPYSSSKACSEIVTSCWRDSFFSKSDVMIASARAGNVIGGGDFSKDRIIPDIVRSISRNEELFLRSPKATRPWQHVCEPLLGYMMLAMKLFQEGNSYATAYNFGPDKESSISVRDIADLFIQKIGKGSYKCRENSELYEAKTLRLDNKKSKTDLGWNPLFTFEQAIDFTACWYENYFSRKQKIRDFTIEQINKFCELYDKR